MTFASDLELPFIRIGYLSPELISGLFRIPFGTVGYFRSLKVTGVRIRNPEKVNNIIFPNFNPAFGSLRSRGIKLRLTDYMDEISY
jgi:hypothetical protein